MKCDSVLGHLETGGLLRRMAARMHAVRCSRCASAREALVQAKRELAGAVPLSDHQRSLWLHAGRRAVPEPQLHRRRVAIALAATVAVLIAAAVAVWPNRQTPTTGDLAEVRLQDSVVTTSVDELDTAGAFTRLENDVTQLQSDLDRLGREADLLEARQRVTEILLEYSEW